VSRSIPPLLPHQIETVDGTVHGTGSAMVVTVTTTPGQLAVNVSTDKTGPHAFDMGDGRVWDSIDNSETYTYKKAGTYTVRASNGQASGEASVTVPGAMADAEATEGKGKKQKG